MIPREEIKQMLQVEMNTFKESMVSHMTYMIQTSIKDTMEKEINGKLDAMKKQIEPIATTFENLNWGKRALMWIGISLASIAGFILTVLEIINLIRNK